MGQTLDIMKKLSYTSKYTGDFIQKLLGGVQKMVSMKETPFTNVKVQLDAMREEIVELRSAVADLESKRNDEKYGSGLTWTYYTSPTHPHQSWWMRMNLAAGTLEEYPDFDEEPCTCAYDNASGEAESCTWSMCETESCTCSAGEEESCTCSCTCSIGDFE